MSKAGSMPETQTDQERRDFFRINHDVIFDFQPVDVHTVARQHPEHVIGSGDATDLMTSLRRLDREAAGVLKVIAERDRDLADYLVKMSQKIDLVARRCVFSGRAEHTISHLNISEGGVAFEHDKPLYKDAMIAVRLVFLPSYAAVVAFARVIRSEESAGRYQIATEFHTLSAADRQLIVRENMRAQARRRKLSVEPGAKSE